ncbi:hypothetical protein CG709_13240, partial [Lachnotalea glycerini]
QSWISVLVGNGGGYGPRGGGENDAMALKQIQEMCPKRKAVGVNTREIVYGGGNRHCITQQQPKVK